MTLEELMQPNKYGTIPTLDIVGVGSIVKDEFGYLMSLLNDRPSTYISKHLEVEFVNPRADNSERVQFKESQDNHSLNHYNAYLKYLRPATPEERVFVTAIEGPNLTYYYIYDGVIYCTDKPTRIMPNGTGWVNGVRHNKLENIPVTFYLEDILYRLDLREELP